MSDEIKRIDAQVTILPERPYPHLVSPVVNAPQPQGGIMEWLLDRSHGYRGNKPTGGFWTSSRTPEDQYCCDWARGLATNLAIQMAVPANPKAKPWLLTPNSDARILSINTMSEALRFTLDFRIAKIPLPIPQAGMGVLLTGEITDWERAVANWDAINLTAGGADWVMASKMHGIDSAFATWNCESTLWGRWAFASRAENL